MTVSYDSHLNTQLSRHLRNLEQAECEDLWIEQRVEYIRNNLRFEYSIGDILADYADSDVPNYKGTGQNPKHWSEYDHALNSAVLYKSYELLHEFTEKAIQFQAKEELDELRRSQ